MRLTKNSDVVREKLGFSIPDDYADFLDSVGYEVVNDLEIYGYLPEMTDVDKIPCVIGATKHYRKLNLISDDDICISSDDEFIYTYNRQKRGYFKINHSGEYIQTNPVFK